MLRAECAAGGVQHWQPCAVHQVRHASAGFQVDTARGTVSAPQLVVATGGLSVPKIGATDFGHRLARQFGHRVVEPRPGLVPLTFAADSWAPFAALSGVALEVAIEAGCGKLRQRFVEDLLFTHRGLSGPAVLQASNYWREGTALRIDLTPGVALDDALRRDKLQSRRQLGNQLAQYLPQRLAEQWLRSQQLDPACPMPQVRDRDLGVLAERLRDWQLVPDGHEGWRKAEVTLGGVDTRQLDSQSLRSRLVSGLHFIGEVVDVTGWLGGYNFQWAWSSAAACARALSAAPAVGLAGAGLSG
jgi:predicted Rossmann fold flavoprotein